MENLELTPAGTPENLNPSNHPESIQTNSETVQKQHTTQEVISLLEELIQKPIQDVRDEVEKLKAAFMKSNTHEWAEKKAAHIAQGLEEVDFVITPTDIELRFKDLMTEYRTKKAELLKIEEEEKTKNLEKKTAILNQIKEMTEDLDSIGKNYNQFQQLQQDFKAITNIPASEVNPLWKSFHTLVEHYYDLLKINKDLRDYDFKKNMEIKTGLCEACEKLAEQEDVIAAFKSLQSLHEEWKSVGPVAKELRDELWERFKNASTQINKAHQAFFETIKSKELENQTLKENICQAIEELDLTVLNTFNDWEAKTQEIIEMQNRWKEIGFASKKINNTLYERFRKACDLFFQKKSDFFKGIKEEFAENLEKKKALCEKAEALKESTQWKETADELIALQKEWKTIGSVPKKYSDAIWKRFISACDYFFEQKEKNFASKKSVEQENLKAKREIIEKLNAIDQATDTEEAKTLVRSLMEEWNKIGHVPFKEKDKVYNEYHAILDKYFENTNRQQSKKRLNKFAEELQKRTGGASLPKERDRLARQWEQLKSELATYENNMGFLNISSKNGSGLLKEMSKKMDHIRNEMSLLEEKIRVIDENQQA